MATEPSSNPAEIELGNLPFFAAQQPTDPPAAQPAPGRPTRQSIPQGAAQHLTRSLGATESQPSSTEKYSSPEEQAEQRAVEEVFESLRGVGRSQAEEQEFWSVVAVLRSRAADRQADETQSREGLSEEEREQIGRRHIQDVVAEWVREQMQTTGRDRRWSIRQQEQAAQAVFDQMFRLGRFQPLIDEEGVENVHINGHDEVWVELVGGRMERRPAVAESDEQLMADLQFLASRNGEEARPFTSAHPDLDMDLMGSVRLAALAPPIVPRPSAVFRIHRYVNITMEEMVDFRTLTREAADFLTACVAARKSIVISGFGGDGKTTLMRALADRIGHHEQIVTIEKDRELHLERMEHRPMRPFPLQYRPGAGERLADGSQAGEYTLEKAMEKALRLNSQRILVGEVRGPEITAMLQAMQTGAGTFCTTHAYDPDDCLDRLAGLGMARYGEAYMARQLGHHLDVVVQLDKITQADGTRLRKVTWISEVLPAEGERKVATQPLFRLYPGEQDARVVSAPSNPRLRADLERAGYDMSRMGAGA